MFTRQLSLRHGMTTRAVNIHDDQDIPYAIQDLEVPHPKPVIVLVGGAGGIGWMDIIPVWKAISIVAMLAEETESVVVDGGTQAGIMAEIGRQRINNRYSFPLIGVVCNGLLMKEDLPSILDPNHTHFILVPGTEWGDESEWISKIATSIAGGRKSITILVNGGKISRTDVEHSLLQRRPTFVMRGTGRMADKITPTGNVFAVDISQKLEDILKYLETKLA